MIIILHFIIHPFFNSLSSAESSRFKLSFAANASLFEARTKTHATRTGPKQKNQGVN
jgi:hypothetical protein